MNKQAIYDDLIEAFISYQYRLEHPMPSPTETPAVMQLQYQNDYIFNNKVKSLASGVMHVLEKHLD